MLPEQTIWDSVLSQLQLQMTTATFDTCLKGAHLVSVDGNLWQVAVKNDQARDWLENRLHSTILRAVANETGLQAGQLSLQFIVVVNPTDNLPDNLTGADHPLNGHANGVVRSTDYWRHDDVSRYEQFTAPIQQTNNKTGYYPLPRFFTQFWEEYLSIRWKQAGRRAWALRQKLLSEDTRKITGKNFTPWTPVIETSFEALANLISTNRAVITGRRGQCQRYEQERKDGRPRGDDCCGRHTAVGCRIEMAERGHRQRHCYFWRPGALEVLSLEKMVVVEQSGSNRYHQLRLQVYHSLPPVLTPFQVGFLPEALQKRHKSWLEKHGDEMGWRLPDWSAVPGDLETFIDCDPAWAGEDRELNDRYLPNPYPGEQFYHDTCHDRTQEEKVLS
ncbi:MAG: hypothetical protein Kow0031_28620 [Anaerolineae bacterium]